MEPRRFRQAFFNPFTERKVVRDYFPLFRGFFRAMPLHRWSAFDIQRILAFTAANPTLFGFPQQPTCVVNTMYFLPSFRNRVQGVFVFGYERGCKSIIIPSSCSGEPFDTLDANLIEPLFRFNPGVEYVYLSLSCQEMAPHLASILARSHRLKELTLEGWDDAVAIHRIVMACKNVEVVDTYSLDDPPRFWKNEISVQALSTMIEMHPKLRAVKSHRLYLADWLSATQFSRCRHNVALVTFVCDYVGLLYLIVLLLIMFPAYAVFRLVTRSLKDLCTEPYRFFWGVIGCVFTIAGALSVDFFYGPRFGRSWVHLSKYGILLKLRLDLWARSSARKKMLATVKNHKAHKSVDEV